MDDSPEDVIRRELSPSERLLWAGRPPLGLRLRAIDAFLIPFSLLWGGFAIVWEGSVITIGAPKLMALAGIPFVLVGLYVIFGRFWVDARQRSATVYGITSERVVIVSGVFSRKIKSLNIETLSDVSLTERTNGSGTITFGPTPPWYMTNFGGGWPSPGQPVVPTLEHFANARDVYEIIRQAQRAVRQPV
ncbi:PH domain-containing protein [Singulisphaera rosea]